MISPRAQFEVESGVAAFFALRDPDTYDPDKMPERPGKKFLTMVIRHCLEFVGSEAEELVAFHRLVQDWHLRNMIAPALGETPARAFAWLELYDDSHQRAVNFVGIQ